MKAMKRSTHVVALAAFLVSPLLVLLTWGATTNGTSSNDRPTGARPSNVQPIPATPTTKVDAVAELKPQFSTATESGAAGFCPGFGDCCVANGSPGCDNTTCCFAICEINLLCCKFTWDEACADLAAADPDNCPQCQATSACLSQFPNQTDAPFSDLDCDACGGIQILAENFTVPANREVDQLKWWGGYFPGNNALAVDAFTIVIRADDGSGLPGAVINTVGPINVPRVLTGIILFGVNEYEYTLTISPNKVLGPGTYWVEIYNDTTRDPSGDDWGWEVGTLDAVNGIPGEAFTFTLPEAPWSPDAVTDQALVVSCKRPPPPACGNPSTGDCCSANGTPFCDDATCCETICANDPSCCELAWGFKCAAQAQELCPVCQGPVCGDGACEAGENSCNCSQDCPGPCCGNGACEAGENCTTCPQDCPCPPGQQCNNGVCEALCGNGFCGDPGENCTTCPQDCPCPPGEQCVGGVCGCGNGACDGSETCQTCPVDCGPCCPNGACDFGETCTTCPQDCPCPPGEQCVGGVCVVCREPLLVESGLGFGGSRFILIDPNPLNGAHGLQVTNLCTGQVGYVTITNNTMTAVNPVDHDDGAQGLVNIGEATAGNLCTDGDFRTSVDWESSDMVNPRLLVTGDMITPQARYEVRSVCGCGPPALSAPAVTSHCTCPYGDANCDFFRTGGPDALLVFLNGVTFNWQGNIVDSPGAEIDINGDGLAGGGPEALQTFLAGALPVSWCDSIDAAALPPASRQTCPASCVNDPVGNVPPCP